MTVPKRGQDVECNCDLVVRGIACSKCIDDWEAEVDFILQNSPYMCSQCPYNDGEAKCQCV